MKPPQIPELRHGSNQNIWLNRPRFGLHREPVNNNLMFTTGRTVYVPTLEMMAVINAPDRAEVPCKEILGPNGGHLRPPAGNIMQGYVAPTGNQHNQKLGMGSTPEHPINTPVLKNANSFYAWMNADLGKRAPLVMKNGKIVKKKK
jgi:hypothetical protein